MRLGIVTRNRNSWSSTQLQEASVRHNVVSQCFDLPHIVARVGYSPNLKANCVDLMNESDGLLIRPIGRGSIEELVFRMDVLYRLQRSGLYVVNPPEAIEHCVDKYDVLTILDENGVQVPRTAVTENADEAVNAFNELGGDVIIKPLFGSRGAGATRINDAEIALTVFRTIAFYRGVVYIQEFVDHGFSDIRTLIVGHRVVAAMRRVATSWKTNYSQGAHPEPVKLDKTLEDLSLKAARLVNCKIAGVDLLESKKGPFVIEVNSQPGWKGLQSVSSVNVADEIVDFVVSEMKK